MRKIKEGDLVGFTIVHKEETKTLKGKCIAFVPAGTAVSSFIPADVPFNLCHYKVDIGQKDRFLVLVSQDGKDHFYVPSVKSAMLFGRKDNL